MMERACSLQVFAAIFSSLPPDTYVVLEPDGSVGGSVDVPPNQVTYAEWDE